MVPNYFPNKGLISVLRVVVMVVPAMMVLVTMLSMVMVALMLVVDPCCMIMDTLKIELWLFELHVALSP